MSLEKKIFLLFLLIFIIGILYIYNDAKIHFPIHNVHISGIKNANKENMKISSDIILEEYKSGKEYTVGILDNFALPVIQLIPPGKFYDYEAKYNSNETKYICPSGLDQNTEEEIKKLSIDCFRALNCRGWGRVDLIIDKQNKPWIIELNTVPGMTEHSLVPMAANQKNINFDELVLKILDTSLE